MKVAIPEVGSFPYIGAEFEDVAGVIPKEYGYISLLDEIVSPIR